MTGFHTSGLITLSPAGMALPSIPIWRRCSCGERWADSVAFRLNGNCRVLCAVRGVSWPISCQAFAVTSGRIAAWPLRGGLGFGGVGGSDVSEAAREQGVSMVLNSPPGYRLRKCD